MLGKLHFLLADTHVLPDAKPGRRDSNASLLATILRHMSRTSASFTGAGAMSILEEPCYCRPKQISLYLGVFLYFKFLWSLSGIVLWALSTTSRLTSGYLQTWNWMPPSSNMSWKCLFRNILHLFVRTHSERRVSSSSSNNDWNDEAMEGPLYIFAGTRYTNFENISITDKNIWVLRCTLRGTVHLTGRFKTHPLHL